jgi:hypothetical protein
MKIGTSLSRCVRDIYDGVVSKDQVVVIVARTDFDPEDDSQWSGIWRGYAGDGTGSMWSNPEWINHQDCEQEFRDICIYLKKSGKLHQPRQYGAHPTRLKEYWYDLVLSEDVVDSNPAAKKAWENYKLIAGLS